MSKWRRTEAFLAMMECYDNSRLYDKHDMMECRHERDMAEIEFICHANVTGVDSFHLCVPPQWDR